jgi:hypothetical protein
VETQYFASLQIDVLDLAFFAYIVAVKGFDALNVQAYGRKIFRPNHAPMIQGHIAYALPYGRNFLFCCAIYATPLLVLNF